MQVLDNRRVHDDQFVDVLERVLALPSGGAAAAWHWFTHYFLGNFFSWTCEFDEAVSHLEAAARVGDSAGNRASASVARGAIGLSLVYRGRLSEAVGVVEKALANGAESRDPTADALTHIYAGALRCREGSFAVAKTHLTSGLRLTDELAQDYWHAVGLGFLGDTLIGLGSASDATAHYGEALRILVDLESLPSWQNISRLRLAHAKALASQGTAAIRVDEMEEWRRANQFPVFEGLSARLIAGALLAREDAELDEVRQWIEAALEADNRNELSLDLAHDHVLFAQLLKREGDHSRMIEKLERARTLFERCGAMGFLADTDQRLATEDKLS